MSITSPCPFIHSNLCLFQVYAIPRKYTFKYYQHVRIFQPSWVGLGLPCQYIHESFTKMPIAISLMPHEPCNIPWSTNNAEFSSTHLEITTFYYVSGVFFTKTLRRQKMVMGWKFPFQHVFYLCITPSVQ